jgi:DNA-binding transcriptional ArsR family regulator
VRRQSFEGSFGAWPPCRDPGPQNVSRHLGILYRAGIVARRREGTRVHYSLADYSACRLLEQALSSLSGQIEELADLVKPAA